MYLMTRVTSKNFEQCLHSRSRIRKSDRNIWAETSIGQYIIYILSKNSSINISLGRKLNFAVYK